jgi:hypothetical protein
MRGAFIVRLDVTTNPSKGIFEGWVEEVDSGKEIRFFSSQELLNFLSDRLRWNHSPSQQIGTYEILSPEDEDQ